MQKKKSLKEIQRDAEAQRPLPPVSRQVGKRRRTDREQANTHSKRSRDRPRKTRPPDRVPERAVGAQVRPLSLVYLSPLHPVWMPGWTCAEREESGRVARARQTGSFPKGSPDVMILRLLLPYERVLSSLVFATVAHSAPSALANFSTRSWTRIVQASTNAGCLKALCSADTPGGLRRSSSPSMSVFMIRPVDEAVASSERASKPSNLLRERLDGFLLCDQLLKLGLESLFLTTVSRELNLLDEPCII